MGTLILREDSSSFSTDNAARMAAGRKKLKKFTIVPHNGGYAINVEEEIQMIPSAQAAPETPINPIVPLPEVIATNPEPVKHQVTTPWRPSRVLEIPERLKTPGFVYRWCDKNKAGNIQKKLSEGWEVDKEISRKLTAIATRTINDGSPLDGTAQVRELVVMKMPKEMADSRNRYYQDRANMATKAAQEELKRKMGGQAYGEIKEERN